MKNNNTFKLLIIFILAFLLRIWFLNKPEGLWNDEYVSWYIASQKDLWIFFTDMVRNCHTPLYYLYLKLWMFFFNDTDISLRYSSVIPSALSVIVMYFAGKELRNQKLGYLCAVVTAISSFLIYFAQEVRLYSLLFLMTSLAVLYSIRIMKKPVKKDLILFFLFSMLIVLTHTLGIMYVFLLIIFTIQYILSKLNKELREKILYNICIYVILPILAIIILVSPFIYNILTYSSLSQFWTGFSIAKVFLTFSDYLTPIQSNIINTSDSILTYIYKNSQINYVFIIFSIVPMLIAIYGIYRALASGNRKLNYLFLSASIFFIYLILISITGRMVLITKYSTEIYPVLILTFCYGLCRIQNKKLKQILITAYICLNLLYILAADDSAPKRTRPEGHRCVVELLRNSRLRPNDYVLLTYYDKDKFDRYLSERDNYKFYSVNKFNFNYFMYNGENYKKVINNGKYLYKDSFKEFPNKNILNYSKYTFQNNMKKGDKIGIILLKNVSFLSNDNIQNILKDEKQYSKTPFIFLVFSSFRNSMLYSFRDDFHIDSITHAGDWTLIVYRKIKD